MAALCDSMTGYLKYSNFKWFAQSKLPADYPLCEHYKENCIANNNLSTYDIVNQTLVLMRNWILSLAFHSKTHSCIGDSSFCIRYMCAFSEFLHTQVISRTHSFYKNTKVSNDNRQH